MYKRNLLGLSVIFFILFAAFAIFGADSFSAGKFAVLKYYEYLLKNGREVTGTVTAADERYEFSNQHANSYYYYLIYEYNENGKIWSTEEYITWGKINFKPNAELRNWCESRIGSEVKLFIDDRGRCVKSGKERTQYKNQREHIYVGGSVLLAGAGIFLAGLSVTLVFYFKKPKNKNCRYVEGR